MTSIIKSALGREGFCGRKWESVRAGCFGGLRKAIDGERQADSVSQLSSQPHHPLILSILLVEESPWKIVHIFLSVT